VNATRILEGHGYLVPGLLTREECAGWRAEGERRGLEEGAPITTGRGFEKRPDIRNNARAMWDDPDAAASLWAKLSPHLPETFHTIRLPDEWRSVGLNERLRLYRYRPGQAFRWHADGPFVRGAEERSLYTLLVFLDAPERGGQTEFHGAPPIIPKPGLALLFWHPLLHQGAEVEAGEKHVLRTDVMFRRT